MCIVSTVSSVRVVGNVSVCGVNKVELRKKKKSFMSGYITANRLTLNTKKSNFIVFHPYQKQLAYQPKICMFDNEQNKYVDLESTCLHEIPWCTN